MKKVIHNLRQRPEHERIHILNIVIFILAIILIGFWILSLNKNISKAETKNKTKEDLKPFSVLKNSIVINPVFEDKR
jgi:hypothetical protein